MVGFRGLFRPLQGPRVDSQLPRASHVAWEQIMHSRFNSWPESYVRLLDRGETETRVLIAIRPRPTHAPLHPPERGRALVCPRLVVRPHV
eukprot:scaffold20_cov361-Prasinococcus_capsulatus_cf.AAC.11